MRALEEFDRVENSIGVAGMRTSFRRQNRLKGLSTSRLMHQESIQRMKVVNTCMLWNDDVKGSDETGANVYL